jgi:uncharacterized protein (DUF433 family)
MPLAQTHYQHVVLDEKGVPYIEGTTMKVVELALNYLSTGASPEELKLQHPYLELGQVYSALAYYWDHKDYFDREIEDQLGFVNELRRTTPEPAFITRLRALKQK